MPWIDRLIRWSANRSGVGGRAMAFVSSRVAMGVLLFKSNPAAAAAAASSASSAGAPFSRSHRRRPMEILSSAQNAAASFATSKSVGGRPYEALLLDIGGTLLETAEPIAEVYAGFGEKYGVKVTPDAIKKGFKRAFAEPWPERLRYEGDGRPFWRHAVATATGCSEEAYFEELYSHFGRGDAWKVADGAQDGLTQLRDAGVKLAVVSNFDSRLRPVLQDLRVDSLFDVIIVSSEIGFEKPAPQIFEAALKHLKVDAGQAVHVGDDAVADKAGAQAVGIEAWLWKKDVKKFQEIVDRILEPEGSSSAR